MCKEKFLPKKKGQLICSVSCALQYVNKKNKDEFDKKTRELKRTLYTTDRVHLTKKAQTVFNKYIRLRDQAAVCISCNKTAGQMHAGHYRPRGAYPALRFESDNCHMQCAQCNKYKGGNLSNYRINLIKKIGLKRVEWLEGAHPQKIASVEELQNIYKKYRKLTKELTYEC